MKVHVRGLKPLCKYLCVLALLTLSAQCFGLVGADVALYNDSIAPVGKRGAWPEGVTAIKNMLTTLGLTYEEVSYADVNLSPLDFNSLYDVIIVPGGFALWYNHWISLAGKDRIRNFVANGGGYFGICAGSFFACDVTPPRWYSSTT